MKKIKGAHWGQLLQAKNTVKTKSKDSSIDGNW